MEQKYSADPETVREIQAFVKEFEEGFNKNDAAALAALCTKDAVQVSPAGPICGRQAIEKNYLAFFQQSHPTNIVCSVDQVYTAGNVSWNFGDYSFTVEGEDSPISVKGYRLDILVREGQAWKEFMSCYNVAPPSRTPETA